MLIIGDADADIRNASQFLDRLLKDLVMEYHPDRVNDMIPVFASKLVEEKFTKFSGEPRDAREKSCI